MNNNEYMIYKFVNNINGKSYIGYTSDPKRRFSRHKRANGSAPYFHNAIVKYGWDSFNLSILEEHITTEKEAKLLEMYFIKINNSFDAGYNLTEGGDGKSGLTGELCPNSKYSEEFVSTIIADDCSHIDASKKYNLDRKYIQMIRVGKIWKALDRSMAPKYKDGRSKLTKSVVEEIIFDNCSHIMAAEKYNITVATIYDIRTGRSWKYLDRIGAPLYDVVLRKSGKV